MFRGLIADSEDLQVDFSCQVRDTPPHLEEFRRSEALASETSAPFSSAGEGTEPDFPILQKVCYGVLQKCGAHTVGTVGVDHEAQPPETDRMVVPAVSSKGDERDGWQLVTAAQLGDQEAFGLLYERHVRSIFGYLLMRSGDRWVAEDLTSETFLRALRRLESVSDQGRDVGAWFMTIARNLLLDHWRSGRYRLEQPSAEIGETDSVRASPEDELLAVVSSSELLRCVHLLAPGPRECLILRFFHGLSVAETAATMGRTEGAVKALQYRAVRHLPELLPICFR